MFLLCKVFNQFDMIITVRDWSLITGRGGGLHNLRGAMLKGGTKSCGVVFTQ